MTTRFTYKSKSTFGVNGLQSSYDGTTPSSFVIPSVGIEDVDAALFKLFDKEIPFQITTHNNSTKELSKVPVIFASSEKWALAKRSNGVRDKQGSLILPLITVVRTSLQQSFNDDITGRGINQQTGELVIQRKLDNSDRDYQNLINKFLIKNQDNIAVNTNIASENQISTSRQQGELTLDQTINDGGLLSSNIHNNVTETIVVPSPQFFTAVYDVTFWTQYTFQMTQLLEVMISSFLPQGNAWKLETSKGYWYVATIDGNAYNPENNADDMSTEERILKYKFTVKIPGYIFASSAPGVPIAIKRYVSFPTISFDVGVASGESSESEAIEEPFLGADDPTLPMSIESSKRQDKRDVGGTKLYPNISATSPNDPSLQSKQRGVPLQKFKKVIGTSTTGKQTISYVKVVTTNKHTGETVFASGFDLGKFDLVTDD